MNPIRTCPKCGSNNFRSSERKGLVDGLAACIGLAPFRCRNCHRRYYRFWSRTGRELKPLPSEQVPSTPEIPEAAAPSIQQAVEPQIPPPIAPAILILDRDFSIRKLLRRVLERQQYRVHEIVDRGDLLSELGVRPADLLIADLELSSQEALQTVARLQAGYPNLKVILLSGSWGSAASGCCAVLPKPLRTEVLLERVRMELSPAAEFQVQRDVNPPQS